MNATIICEYPLDLPREKLEEGDLLKFNETQWDEYEFHTLSPLGGGDFLSDLFGLIDKYTISEDGQLYKHLTESKTLTNESGNPEAKEVEVGIELQEFTGEILFSTLFYGKDHDYFIEFKSLFWKGDMKEIELSSNEKHSNEKRLEAQKAYIGIVNQLAQEEIKEKKWYSKTINTLLYLIFCPIKFVLILLVSLIRKIELWVKGRLK